VHSARGVQAPAVANKHKNVTIKINMQRQTTRKPYLLDDEQCIYHITRPKMSIKNPHWRAAHLSIARYYVSAFTTTIQIPHLV